MGIWTVLDVSWRQRRQLKTPGMLRQVGTQTPRWTAAPIHPSGGFAPTRSPPPRSTRRGAYSTQSWWSSHHASTHSAPLKLGGLETRTVRLQPSYREMFIFGSFAKQQKGEWYLLTDCQVVVTLWKGNRVFLIHQRDGVGGPRVKASKGHVASSIADMALGFISGCCIREQSLDLRLDGGVGNLPVHPGTVDGWNKWGSNSRQVYLSPGDVIKGDLNRDERFSYLSPRSHRRLRWCAQRNSWPRWNCVLFQAGDLTACERKQPRSFDMMSFRH